jgi:hypothetical protein
MFSFEGKSPWAQYMNCVKIWLLLTVITFGGCVAGFKLDAPYTEDTSHNATLEVAYIYNANCNKHGDHCVEKYKGRFMADDGKRYDRDIDGFFYHSFVDKGRQEMPAYITLSKNDMGIGTPGWIQFLMFCGVLCGFIFVAGGICLMLGSVDAEYAQKDWEREQERKHWRG